MSGAVDIFMGSGTAPVLTLVDSQQYVVDINPVTSTFTLSNTGAGWLTGGSAANYDVRATLTGGTALAGSSSPLGSWLNLATTRTWTVSKGTGGSGSQKESDVLFEFTATGTTTPILNSATIQIIAETA